jgi:hypothetical protein
VNLVGPLAATLAGLVLFFVPGLLLLALLPAREREALELDEALFLTVATSVCVAAWTGLLLAELGLFSVVRAALVLLAAAAAVGVVWRRRLGAPWPRPRGAAALVPAALVLAAALALQARPTEYLVGGRDPGVYVSTMALIARTGGIAYVDPGVLAIPGQDVELFYRNPDAPDFSWGRFMGVPLESPKSGRVVPEFFHLFPAFGAYLFQAMGVKGALATPPVFGVLGTLAVYFALRRLLGGAPALLAALMLALNVVQVWFARYPVSEGFSQLLYFLAFLAVALWEERGHPVWAAVAGGALGLSLLVRIDSVLMLAPLAVYLLARHAAGQLPWRRALPLLVPLAILAAHAIAHAALFSRKYLLNLAARPYWQQPFWVWALALMAAVAVVASVRHWGPRAAHHWRVRGESLRAAAMAALALLALYAYFLRPWLSAWAGGDGNDRALALPGGALLRALGFHRLAAHDAQSLVRLGWFVTPLALGLALLGLLLMLWRWRPRYLFPLLLTLTFAVFYLYKMRVWNDYYFALRRFVPLVLPWVMAWAALLLWRMAGGSRARAVLAGALALALLAWGRGHLRAAAQHPPHLAAAVGRARRERAGAGALQPRPRPPGPPGARVAGARPQHLLRAHLQHRPVRAVPAAGGGAELRHLRVGARAGPPAARKAAALPALPHLARGAAGGAAGAGPARGGHRRQRRLPGLRLLRQGRRRRAHLPLDGELRFRLPARRAAGRHRAHHGLRPAPARDLSGRREGHLRRRAPGRLPRAGRLGGVLGDAARSAAGGLAPAAPGRARLAAGQRAARLRRRARPGRDGGPDSARGGRLGRSGAQARQC